MSDDDCFCDMVPPKRTSRALYCREANTNLTNIMRLRFLRETTRLFLIYTYNTIYDAHICKPVDDFIRARSSTGTYLLLIIGSTRPR